MPGSRDDERVGEAGESEGQASACDKLTREAEDLGMYWGTGRIATWCPTGECVTKPQESGYCETCEEKIELLKQKIREVLNGS